MTGRATFSQASFIAASRIAPAQPWGTLGHPHGGMTSILQIFQRPPDLNRAGAMETKNLSRYWCRNTLLSVFHWSPRALCRLVQSGKDYSNLRHCFFFSNRSRFPSDYRAQKTQKTGSILEAMEACHCCLLLQLFMARYVRLSKWFLRLCCTCFNRSTGIFLCVKQSLK